MIKPDFTTDRRTPVEIIGFVRYVEHPLVVVRDHLGSEYTIPVVDVPLTRSELNTVFDRVMGFGESEPTPVEMTAPVVVKGGVS